MAVLTMFADDSGSEPRSEWFVLAGYLGHCDGWDRFDELWQAELDRTPRLNYFKSVEAESLRGGWHGMDKSDRNARIESFISVIGKCAIIPICVRVRHDDYAGLFAPCVPKEMRNPYFLLAKSVIQSALSLTQFSELNPAIKIETG